MNRLSESSDAIEYFAAEIRALFGGPSRRYRYNADEYQIVVVQGVHGEVMQNQYRVSRFALEDSIGDGMIEHICRTMDYSLLDATGFVGKHRLWGSAPIVDGMPIRHHPDAFGVYILDGPHGGNRYSVQAPGYMMYLPTTMGFNAEYFIHMTTLGWVGVYARGAYA